ncbi:hypothetical protein CDD83_6278 [Cordyceps sp. RAO-2017]|nr:hypothetical protein CDD83_6278 [Cordyceps sp. RAO-2017]
MRVQPSAAVLVLAGIVAPAVTQSSDAGLLASLRREGASRFADFLESDPSTLDAFLRNARTVYAPSDESLARPRRRDDTTQRLQQANYQGCQAETNLAAGSMSLPGRSEQTMLVAPKLQPQPITDSVSQKLGNSSLQVIVADSRPDNTKRWLSRSLVQRRQSAQSWPKLCSGLGATTNIMRGGIKFDRGTIYLTDGYFTLPQSISRTVNAIGQTTFASLAAIGGLTQQLDDMHAVTIFLPSNTALASVQAGNMSGSAAAQLASSHIVPNFVGYLPRLRDGANMRSQTGQVLKVRVVGGKYYINDAAITQANIILDSGVAHVIDKSRSR